ncbi:MAG: glycine cleavage system protein GcvH [Polyangiales bacterium]
MSDAANPMRYTEEHEWARLEGELLRVGITPYAVAQLGDVTLVELPAIGTRLAAKERFGDIESVKTVSELYAPVAGEVVEVNRALVEQPEQVNESPLEGGWMIVLRPDAPEAWQQLLDAAAYEAHVNTLDD